MEETRRKLSRCMGFYGLWVSDYERAREAFATTDIRWVDIQVSAQGLETLARSLSKEGCIPETMGRELEEWARALQRNAAERKIAETSGALTMLSELEPRIRQEIAKICPAPAEHE